MLLCSYVTCEATFSKGEHLRRHERTHTGVKPFACKVCSRSFSRQDSLMRHQRLHKKSTVAVPSSDAASTPAPITPDSINRNQDAENQPCPQDLAESQSHDLPTEFPPDLSLDLIWPDSDQLFQTLVNSDLNNSLSAFQYAIDPALASPVSFVTASSIRAESLGTIPADGNEKAVQNVSKMISALSSTVTAAAESSISSVFLDECLHMFFVRFIPTFPVLHRVTFVFKDCTHQLLLNAIAIGSLYLGPKDAVCKGEALWHLAHTAIATSWQTLITHRGPYDALPGVQLVISALLGQIYGVLSKNRSIRTTSQAFQSLSFFWARHCGMFDSKVYSLENVPSLDMDPDEKDRQWRIWAAKEIQQRAVLAHHILDGLISHMTGGPTSTQHTTNQLLTPSCECAFDATTPDEWIRHMQTHSSSQRPNFRNLLQGLFRPTNDLPYIDHNFTAFSFRVLLEGLQSLVADCGAESSAIFVPSKADIEGALRVLHQHVTNNHHLSNDDRLETLLRWHTVCLDLVINSSFLCGQVCKRLHVDQNVWRGQREHPPDMDLYRWTSSTDARKALLHALAIHDIIEQLPRGRAHALHMPNSLFAASTVYAAFSLTSAHRVKVPTTIVWLDAILDLEHPCVALAEISESALDSDTIRFIRGEMVFGPSAHRNLLYDLNSVQKLFRCLYSQWGIAFNMEAVVDQWIRACRPKH